MVCIVSMKTYHTNSMSYICIWGPPPSFMVCVVSMKTELLLNKEVVSHVSFSFSKPSYVHRLVYVSYTCVIQMNADKFITI